MATVADMFRQTQSPALDSQARLLEYVTARPQPMLDDEVRGPLQRIIDVYSAPLYGVASVANALINGDRDLASAAWRGLTLQERKTFVDLLKAHGTPGAEVVGLVLDIGLDPMTYLGGAPFKLLRTAWTAARRTRTVDEVVNAVRDFGIVDSLGRVFSTTWKKPQEYVELKNAIRRALVDKQREAFDAVEQFVREVPENERVLMNEVRKKPWLLNQLSPNAQKRYLDIARELDTYALRGYKEGLWTLDTVLKWLGEYVPIRYTERLRRLNITVGGKALRPSFVRPRVFQSLEEARDFALDAAKLTQASSLQEAQNVAKALDSKWGGTFFAENVAARADVNEIRDWAQYTARLHTPIDDIAKSLLIYRTEWAQYEAQSRFLREALQRFGRPVSEGVTAGKDEIVFKVPEWLQKAVGTSTQWLVPKEIGKELNDLSHVFVTGGEASKLWRMFDRMTGVWKATSTVWRLPFHIRNLYSNYFMMYLAGVPVDEMPRLSKEALRVLAADIPEAQSVLRFKPTDVVPGLNRTYKGLLDDLRKLGVVNTGFLSSDSYTLRDVYAFLRGESETLSRKDAVKRLIDVPNKVGRWVENTARVALHLDGLTRGLDDMSAARRVFKYLFDYEDITPIERQYLRRVYPWYTWLRKNIPLQITHMLQTPEKYLKPARAIHAWNVAFGFTEDDHDALPSWMQDLLWVKTPLKDKNGRQIYAYLDLPMQDIARLAQMVQSPEMLAQQAHPLVDIILTAMNVDVFPTARPLERFPGELEPAPPWVVLLPEAAQEALGVDMMWDKKTGQMVLGLPKRTANIMRTIVPEDTLNTLAQTLGGARVLAVPEDSPWLAASYMSGIRFRPVDMDEERRWRALERKQRLSWAVALMRQRRRPLTKEELDDLLQ